MERFQSGLFRRIIFIHMSQALVFSITGIVDSAVAGRFWGTEALAGMKLAMPVFSVLYMFGGVLSTGLTIQITKLLAKGDRNRANQNFLWVCAAVGAVSIVCVLAAAAFPDTLAAFFADYTDDASLYADVKGYLIPVLYGSMPIMLQVILSSIAALEGEDKCLTRSIAAVLITDVAGDLAAAALNAGVMGISIASVLAYTCACAVLLGPFISGKTLFRSEPLQRDRTIIIAVVIAGSPVALKYLCEFIYPMAVNRMMLSYGTVEGLAALSIQDASHYFPLALCEGISAAVIMITGMFAAEYDSEGLRRERKDIEHHCIIYGTAWAMILAVLAPLLVKLFTEEASLQSMGASAFRWYLLGVPFMCINEAAISYLNGIGSQKGSGALTLINMLALPVFFTWLLGSKLGMPGIFASFAVHQIVLASVLISLQLIRRHRGYGEGAWKKIDAELRGDLMTMEQVEAASDAVIRLCEEHGVDRKQAVNVGLCLEELASNTLLHGYKDSRDKYLEFRFVISDPVLVLRLRDNGRQFDLTERYKLLDPDDPASGLGLRIVFAAAEEVSYSHVFDMNNVCIRVPKQKKLHYGDPMIYNSRR